jgi:hypothetical protein
MRRQYGKTVLSGIVFTSVLIMTCARDNVPPEGLAEAPPGNGPMIKFDLDARPFPEIPFPNDLATRVDESSPTGRRLNVSVIAPTQLESDLREKIDRLTGFGIFGSITMSFDKPIDINTIIDRHWKNNGFSDDVAFLINLNPASPNYGKAVLLDMGRGNFPLQLEKNWQYFPNDSRYYGSNLFLETYNEDENENGVFDPYIDRDTDFDGAFDQPNVFSNGAWRLNDADPWSEYHDLIDFYERETNTLIMRPVLPLEEESVYAVVVTNRLKGLPGPDGKAWPVRSPFRFINHAQQTEALEPLKSVLPRFGLSISDVAFTWKFTTGSQTRGMVTIRRGLYGHGPMGYLAQDFPAEFGGLNRLDLAPGMPDPYIIKAVDLMDIFVVLLPLLGDPFGDVDIGPLLGSYDYVDYFFFGSFQSPGFLVDRDGIATKDYPADDDEIFEMNPLTGAAVVGPNTVTFICSVPRPNYRLEEIRDFSENGGLEHAYVQTHVDHRLGTVCVDSEEGSIDRNQVSFVNGATTVARIYVLTFSSPTTFNAVDKQKNPQGPGDIGSPFTTNDGQLTINAEAWNGPFAEKEIATIEIESYVDQDTGPFSQTYIVTFTSSTEFEVTDEIAITQGSGIIGADFTTDDGWLTIASGAWSGIFAWGDGFEIETVAMRPPYSTVIEGHGYTSMKFEILGFAGNLGKHGLAVCSMDSVGHGLGLEKELLDQIEDTCADPPPGLEQLCALKDSLLDMLKGRARDLNNDGTADSGGDFWSADTFHTRDIVRQTIVDQMQLVRIIRSFDGERTWKFDINRNDLNDDIAGDLNGDGEVDFGGWTNDFYTWGISLGGILSGILAGIEPAITAAAPVSGGAGLIDIAARSTQGGVVEAVFLRLFGPIVLGLPGAGGTVKLQFLVPDLKEDGFGPCAGYADIGSTTRIQEGDKVVVRNLKTGEKHHAIAEISDDYGRGDYGIRFRVHIPADAVSATEKRMILGWAPDYMPGPGTTCRPVCDVKDPLALGDPIVIEIYNGEHGDIKQVIDTWLQDSRWQGAWFKKGTPLVAPHEGLGHYRGTPNLRKFVGIAQSIMDPADPGTYAVRYHMPADAAMAPNPYYTPLGPIDYRDIEPDIVMGTNVLVIPTIGDTNVPQNTAIAQARVAGMIELFEEDPIYGKTQNQVLIDTGVVEGVEKIQDYTVTVDGNSNYHILFDLDDLDNSRSCDYATYDKCVNSPEQEYICTDDGSIDPTHACGDGYNAPTLATLDPLLPPLRLAVETKTGVAGMRIPYMKPTGQHGFDVPKPSRAFDIDTYLINLIGRYFQSNGTVILDDTCLEADSCIHIPPPPQ